MFNQSLQLDIGPLVQKVNYVSIGLGYKCPLNDLKTLKNDIKIYK